MHAAQLCSLSNRSSLLLLKGTEIKGFMDLKRRRTGTKSLFFAKILGYGTPVLYRQGSLTPTSAQMQSCGYGKCLCCLWACVSCLSLSHCPCTGWRDSVLPVTLEIPLLLHSAPEIQHDSWRDTTQPSSAALCSMLQHTQSKVNLAKQHLYPSGSKAFLKQRRNCGTILSAGFDKTEKVCLGFCLSSK